MGVVPRQAFLPKLGFGEELNLGVDVSVQVDSITLQTMEEDIRIDQGTPMFLRRHIEGHTLDTAAIMNRNSLKLTLLERCIAWIRVAKIGCTTAVAA